ncbi:uncharacterized protein si:ch211-153l6.6 isoform X5 [Mugil cephalus]|uniref:uncharacterized protein si:ch211-153l6.6 isoform X5 n=1 Tax=Mugil cephalus TaxID=48193 RepID=UPI001FB63B8D|nr:uncharacterized protein si:ch211-153l6.6 isoform X5 [Mugil cephalus]
MRPSSRRRVAAWLLALPLGRGGEECARRGRLEMISFWLLCWKLLRATTGLRRNTPELTEGNHDNSSSSNDNSDNNTHNSPTTAHPADPVTMEISSSTPLEDLERDNLFSHHSQEVDERHCPEVHAVDEEAGDRENGNGDQCDYLVFEIGKEKGREGRAESEAEEERGDDGEVEKRGEIEGEEEGRGETEGEVEGRVELAIQNEDRWKVDGDDGITGERETDDLMREIEGEDEGRENIDGEDRGSGETLGEDGGTKEEDGWMEGNDDLTDLLFISNTSLCPLLLEPNVVASVPPEGTVQEAWSHDLGNRDDLSDGHLSDCLQAELAIVYSDSDAGEDQWASFPPCDVTSQVQGSGGILDGTCDRESNEEGREEEEDTIEPEAGKEEQKEEVEEEQEESRGIGSVDTEQMRSRRDLFLRSPSVSSTASSTDPERRVPVDFCVHQESQSENVSTEHVDFLLARQQWKKMEEEVKGQPIPKPGLRAQGSFQGTHTSLYPPTRSPRLKHRPSSLQTSRSPPRPPACRTPTLSISPSPSCSSSLPRSIYHEMTANNVIILEPDSSSTTSRNRLISSAISGLSDWPASLDAVPSANVIVVETSNLIIRSASEFCLSSAPVSAETQESTFSSNPFFKLRSLSSQSLVEQEIKVVRQREEEWRRQREEMWRRRREEEWRRGRERYDTVLVSPGLNDNVSYNVPALVPDKCVSSPSSPSRSRKMERSSLSCDHKFPPSLSSVPRRQNAMAQRWEASLLANQKKE